MRMSVEFVVQKVRIYLLLLRPFTLLAPLIVSTSVIIASLVTANRNDLAFSSLVLIFFSASFSFALLNGASNVLNQATDWKEDILSKPYRLIPKGIVTPKEAYKISFFLYMIAFLLSLSVHILFSIFILIIAFFSITYSHTPRLKKFLLLNQLWVALPRGFFGIIGSWSVFNNPLESLPLSMGCIATIFLFGGTTTKDILDAYADKTVGTKTLVNVFGLRAASFFSLIIMTCAFWLIFPLVYFNIIHMTFLPLVFLGFISIMIGLLMLHNHKNTIYENTSAWTLMYATYFIFAISFAVITIYYSA